MKLSNAKVFIIALHIINASFCFSKKGDFKISRSPAGEENSKKFTKTPLLRNSTPDEEFWKKLSQERSFVPLNYKKMLQLREWENQKISFQVCVSRSTISVFKNSHMIYEVRGKMVNSEMSHGGLHMLVLHPNSGNIMYKRHFKTSQPGESSLLATDLIRILPGKLLLLIVVPFGAYYLDPVTIGIIEWFGSEKIARLAYNETWILMTHTTGRNSSGEESKGLNSNNITITSLVWIETCVTTTLDRIGVSPLTLSFSAPSVKLHSCDWHNHQSKRQQATFCQKYAIYPEICRCNDPLNPKEFRSSSKKLNSSELIPIAMLTALNPQNFYRQLLNLLPIDGASQTPIYVFIDGINEEIIDISTMFGLPIKVHRPQGSAGSSTRLNMHFRFSVNKIFDTMPDASKAIVLEDDLILSPDFISFFHQTSWLLDVDSSIYCVNAFSVNSYPTVASDPTVLRRSGAFPQFGWMVSKQWAASQIPLWVHEKASNVDWDWWLGSRSVKKDKFVLVPEISRTFHAGSAGAHVTGWEQSFFFGHMIYNLDKHVKLQNLHRLKLPYYDEFLEDEIKSAELLEEEFNPCSDDTLAEKIKKNSKVIVMADSENYDENDGFLFIALCLHANNRDFRDIYKGVQIYSLNGKKLYVIGCPLSPFCKLLQGVSLMNPLPKITEQAEERDLAWRSQKYEYTYRVRRQAKNFQEEISMMNFINVNKVLT